MTIKGSRVFDYVVEASAEGGKHVTRKLIAAGFAYPEECANIPGECLFSVRELPTDKPILFTITPRDCFGIAGHTLSGSFEKLDGGLQGLGNRWGQTSGVGSEMMMISMFLAR